MVYKKSGTFSEKRVTTLELEISYLERKFNSSRCQKKIHPISSSYARVMPILRASESGFLEVKNKAERVGTTRAKRHCAPT
jgi:hypothetical protein